MNNVDLLFKRSIDWFKSHYTQYNFFVERDIVWIFQTHIKQLIDVENLPYRVFNDYSILPGKRRSLSTDLAIIDQHDTISVAIEFKYEPSHHRKDIMNNKFPVVVWGAEGVKKDIDRIHQFIREGKADSAYFLFIDEGGYFRQRTAHPNSTWVDWGSLGNPKLNISVLTSQVIS
jgi:hypothetical protein